MSRRWPMYGALRFPLAAYAGSRLAVLAAALLAATLRSFPAAHASLSSVLGAWDGDWYRSIAEHGYPNTVAESGGRAIQSTLAFFPLYPLCLKIAHALLPLSPKTNSVVVAALFGAVAVCLLWSTVRMLFDAATADAAALLFCFLPGAFILSYAYAEGLMICLALVCLAALHRRQWVLAGVAGALATMTRPNAVVLAGCAAWAAAIAIRDRREWRALVAPLLAPLGILGFVGYVGVHTGEPGAWWRVQHEGWGEHLDAGYGVVDDVVNFVVGTRRDPDHIIIFVGVVMVAIGLVLLVRSRLPGIYTIYAVGVLALALGSENLSARPRFVFTAFPLAIAAAHGLRREVVWVLAAFGASLMALLVVWYGWAPPGVVPP